MNVTTEKQVGELFRESMEAMCVCASSVVSDSLQHHGLSLPGSSVHGILHAGILKKVAIFSSRGSS